MKIRTGFVSNSSTSSFVMMGFCIDKKKIEKPYELGKHLGCQVRGNEEDGAPTNKVLVGINIAQWDDCDGCSIQGIDLANTMGQLSELRGRLEEYYTDLDQEEARIQMFTGTCMS